MFVILFDSSPDIVVETYEEMRECLIKHRTSISYEYTLQADVWVVGNRYITIEDADVVYSIIGSWCCPKDYLTYNAHNVCTECKMTDFMKGKTCTYCSPDYGCPDCGKPEKTCACVFNDF